MKLDGALSFRSTVVSVAVLVRVGMDCAAQFDPSTNLTQLLVV
jgi:hypothetical protein